MPLDLAPLSSAAVECAPFPHLSIEGFLPPTHAEGLLADFPRIRQPGSFPIGRLRYGARFREVIEGLTSRQAAALIGEKLDIELVDHPTLVTVRAHSRGKDGRIHVDNPNKLITMLLYLGGPGDVSQGRLRLLRTQNLDDYAAEIVPAFGNLLIFKNGPNAWHGFESFVGARRVVQINWVATQAYATKEDKRHSLSAFFKNALFAKRRTAADAA